MRFLWLLGLGFWVSSSLGDVTAKDQKYVSITLYNNGYALVKDRRAVTLQKGAQTFQIYDLSTDLYPGSLFVRTNLLENQVNIEEFSFHYDRPSLEDLLGDAIGQRVFMGKGQEGVLVNLNKDKTQALVKEGDKITQRPVTDLSFAATAGLELRPRLSVQLVSQVAQPGLIHLTYMTTGLPWQVYYIAEIHPNDEKLDLSGALRLTNKLGIPLRQANIQLIAGKGTNLDDLFVDYKSLNTGNGEQGANLFPIRKEVNLAPLESKKFPFVTFLDQKLYTTYALNFEGASDVDVTGQVVNKDMDTFVLLKFPKPEDMPLLPEGKVWVYKRDGGGKARFLLRDDVKNIPGKGIVFRYGKTNDIKTTLQQTDFKRLSPDVYDSGHRMTLVNTTNHPVKIQLNAAIKGAWKLVKSSHPTRGEDAEVDPEAQHTDAQTLTWNIKIPPQGSEEIRYRVRVTQAKTVESK